MSVFDIITIPEQIVNDRNSFNIPVYVLLPFNVITKKKETKQRRSKRTQNKNNIFI